VYAVQLALVKVAHRDAVAGLTPISLPSNAGGISAASCARALLRMSRGSIPMARIRPASTTGSTGRPALRPGNSQGLAI